MVYDPLAFSMTMNMFMNGNQIYTNSMSGAVAVFPTKLLQNFWPLLSAKNPPPMCMPIPIPYIPIQMEMCMVLFNVMQPGNNMHACMDLEFKMQNIKMMVRLNKTLTFERITHIITPLSDPPLWLLPNGSKQCVAKARWQWWRRWVRTDHTK